MSCFKKVLLLLAIIGVNMVRESFGGDEKLRGAIDEALKCKETGETKTILFGLTGTGYFDMTAYAAYNEGRMSDSVPTDEELQPSIDALPTIPGIQE